MKKTCENQPLCEVEGGAKEDYSVEKQKTYDLIMEMGSHLADLGFLRPTTLKRKFNTVSKLLT